MPLLAPNRFRGKLIVVEGIDGSGKSTQLALRQRVLVLGNILLTRKQPSNTIQKRGKAYWFSDDQNSSRLQNSENLSLGAVQLQMMTGINTTDGPI